MENANTPHNTKPGSATPPTRKPSLAHPMRFESLAMKSKKTRLFESDAERFARNRDEALAYHRRATLFARDELRASLVFNVAAIAIECYMIALCARYKTMPSNHSFGILVADVQAVMPFPPDLAEGIRDLDKIFGICSLDDYHHGTPEAADAQQALTLCESLHKLLGSLGGLPEEDLT